MNTVRHLDLTVIMPIAPGANPRPAIRAIEKSIPKGITAELITVTGTHPTRQRNLASFRANGKILWFLDHDAIPSAGAASRLIQVFRNGQVVAAGGPNLAARPLNAFEARAGRAISSGLGSPFVRARYQSHGEVRVADERSLILCNLAVRKDVFTASGGFDPRLYPNEENEFLNRLQSGPGMLLHVPGAIVRKPRPSTRWRFLHEAFRYGKGRAEQVWVHATRGDLKYVLAVGLLIAAMAWQPWSALGAVLPVGIMVMGRPRSPLALAAARLMAYALGMFWGACSGWRHRSLRLHELTATFCRFLFRSGSFRLSESSSFDLGSITMKGAFRHA